MAQKRKKKKEKLNKPNQKKTSFRVPRIKVKVAGIGGGGCKISSSLEKRISNIENLLIDTDSKSLKNIKKTSHQKKILIKTKKSETLAEAIKNQKISFDKILKGTDLLIIVACLGGETTFQLLPLFLESAKKSSKLTLGIFILPFSFEGETRVSLAKKTLSKSLNHLNAFLVINNQKIFETLSPKISFQEALQKVNNLLEKSLGDLVEILKEPQLINIDFADLREILKGYGNLIYLNSLTFSKEAKIEKSLEELLNNPLQEYKIESPKKVLLDIAGGKDLEITLLQKIAEKVYQLNPTGRIIMGIGQKKNLSNKVRVTILKVGSLVGFQFDKSSKVDYLKGREEKPKILPKNKGQKDKLETKKRKTSLEIQKERELEVKKIIEEESAWDTPAFLKINERRNK